MAAASFVELLASRVTGALIFRCLPQTRAVRATVQSSAGRARCVAAAQR